MAKVCVLHITLLLFGLAWYGGTVAGEDYVEARRLMEAGRILPLQRILKQVRARYPGRVLEVELEQEQDRYIYEIEVLDAAGKVWEVKIDAARGRLLERERERED